MNALALPGRHSVGRIHALFSALVMGPSLYIVAMMGAARQFISRQFRLDGTRTKPCKGKAQR